MLKNNLISDFCIKFTTAAAGFRMTLIRFSPFTRIEWSQTQKQHNTTQTQIRGIFLEQLFLWHLFAFVVLCFFYTTIPITAHTRTLMLIFLSQRPNSSEIRPVVFERIEMHLFDKKKISVY